jgi:ureidoacrylate peracid hydrolase
MHPVSIRQEIVNRVTARRGRYHLFDTLDAKTTAFVVIDMQPTFVAENSPAEVPLSRAIVPNINRLADEMRRCGGTVIWVTHANVRTAGGSDWNGFYERFVASSVREHTIEMNAPRPPLEALWHELTPAPQDLHVVKNRYSALISGASQLERLLRSLGIQTLLIAGTKTNVCCESTGRDAMMLDFNVVMVSDCLAALSDEEHLATLETFIQQFGDVMTSTEVAAILR